MPVAIAVERVLSGKAKFFGLFAIASVGLLGLGWAWMAGDFVVGTPTWVGILISAGVPLYFLWAAFFAQKALGSAGKSHVALVAIATVATLVVAYQPWNPRAVFVRKLYGIRPGMSQQDVQKQMAGYLGGDLVAYSRDWDEARRGVTHTMNYRWNDVDGRYNADVGTVYLVDGRVVYRDFSPD